MTSFAERALPEQPDVTAPDGSEVRILAAVEAGSMAHFRLQPGEIAKAICHRSVAELWFVLSGRGRIWRKLGADEAVLDLATGMSLSLPAGTHFQFRCDGDVPLDIVGVTMPPWPGEDEAVFVDGKWPAQS